MRYKDTKGLEYRVITIVTLEHKEGETKQVPCSMVVFVNPEDPDTMYTSGITTLSKEASEKSLTHIANQRGLVPLVDLWVKPSEKNKVMS